MHTPEAMENTQETIEQQEGITAESESGHAAALEQLNNEAHRIEGEFDSAESLKAETLRKYEETRKSLGMPEENAIPPSIQRLVETSARLESEYRKVQEKAEAEQQLQPEVFESIEAEDFPEVSVVADLIEQGFIGANVHESGLPRVTFAGLEDGGKSRTDVASQRRFVSSRFDVEKVADAIRSSSRFENQTIPQQNQEESEEVVDEDKLDDMARKSLGDVREYFMQAGFVPLNMRESGVPLVVDIAADRSDGQYYHHSIQDSTVRRGEKPVDVIVVGRKHVIEWGGVFKGWLAEKGIGMRDDALWEAATAYLVGHEYGHHVQYAAAENGRDIIGTADEVAPNSLGINRGENRFGDRHSGFNLSISERHAESLGRQALGAKLDSLGFEEHADAILDMLIEKIDKPRHKAFERLMKTGKEKGLAPTEVSDLLLDVRSKLKEAGFTKEAEKVEYNLRHAGYYMPKYTADELRQIAQKE